MRYVKNDVAKKLRTIDKNLTVEQSLDLVSAVLYALREFLIDMKAGDALEIRGLGVFTMKRTEPSGKRFHNPKNMERVIVSSKRKLLFKPSKDIKKELYELK